MSILPVRSLLSEALHSEKIPDATLSYFRQRLRNRLYELILNEFIKQQSEKGLTKVALTRRIGRNDPSIVTRWLSSPGNLRIDTISDLLLAMGTEPDELTVRYLDEQASKSKNFSEHPWLDSNSAPKSGGILSSNKPVRQSESDAQAMSAGLSRATVTAK